VDGANGLFFAATTGASNAGNADAEGATDSATNAFGESDGDFAADCALGHDEFGWNVGPGGFQVVAIANRAAKKVGGAAGDASEAFGKQAASATFGRGNSSAIGGVERVRSCE
jgi:hypothetical protein